MIEEQVDMPFQIGSGHGRGWHLGVLNDMDGPVFLERKLVGLGVDRYW